MISEELVQAATGDFLEYSIHETQNVRHESYEICQWGENGRKTSGKIVAVPSVSGSGKSLPEAITKVETLFEEIVSDDDIYLIQSQDAAKRAFNRLIKEIRIESNRDTKEELRNDPNFWDALYAEETTAEYISPIIGLTFEGDIRVTEALSIRRVNALEKELMLNSRRIGGGSVALQRAIETGKLTHAAVYEHTKGPEGGWENGLRIMSDVGQEAQEELADLSVALQLMTSERFEMSNQHLVDKTFYPAIVSSMEQNSGVQSGMAEPKLISSDNKIVEYYNLVSEADKDEGIRVAIDRLESSYQKTSNADSVVDAVIGIEALLSAGRSGSFQEVRRRAAVLSGDKATYSELGRLQSQRNATVHGEETKVSGDDCQFARSLLSTLLGEVIRVSLNAEISRNDLIDNLDKAITETIEKRFRELISDFEDG